MNNRKLAGYLREKGISQESLSAKSGVSRATIARLLGGDNVTIEQVNKIVIALDMPREVATEIFFGKSVS